MRPPITPDGILSDAATLTALLQTAPDGTELPLTVSGWSMMPFYLHRTTVVLLRRETARPPRRGDAVLFTRPDGALLLHRVLRVRPDGTLTVGGDAQDWTETVRPDRILARVVRVIRRPDGRETAVDAGVYRLAVALWSLGRWWHPGAVRWYRRIRRRLPKQQHERSLP